MSGMRSWISATIRLFSPAWRQSPLLRRHPLVLAHRLVWDDVLAEDVLELLHLAPLRRLAVLQPGPAGTLLSVERGGQSAAGGGLNRAHATWLENALIQRAGQINQSHLENSNEGQPPRGTSPTFKKFAPTGLRALTHAHVDYFVGAGRGLERNAKADARAVGLPMKNLLQPVDNITVLYNPREPRHRTFPPRANHQSIFDALCSMLDARLATTGLGYSAAPLSDEVRG
jgi:hypothetical protein